MRADIILVKVQVGLLSRGSQWLRRDRRPPSLWRDAPQVGGSVPRRRPLSDLLREAPRSARGVSCVRLSKAGSHRPVRLPVFKEGREEAKPKQLL